MNYTKIITLFTLLISLLFPYGDIYASKNDFFIRCEQNGVTPLFDGMIEAFKLPREQLSNRQRNLLDLIVSVSKGGHFILEYTDEKFTFSSNGHTLFSDQPSKGLQENEFGMRSLIQVSDDIIHFHYVARAGYSKRTIDRRTGEYTWLFTGKINEGYDVGDDSIITFLDVKYEMIFKGYGDCHKIKKKF